MRCRHRGPGTTDAITGVANAFRAESPMLLIGGQGALNQHQMGSLQDLPHVDMMTPITKFAATVPSTVRAADMVSMAFRECYNGAPGRLSWRSRGMSSMRRSGSPTAPFLSLVAIAPRPRVSATRPS